MRNFLVREDRILLWALGLGLLVIALVVTRLFVDVIAEGEKKTPLNPYKDGEVGVVEEGAYADLLIADGNPLEDIRVLEDPEKNLRVIMKDGKIYKNTL